MNKLDLNKALLKRKKKNKVNFKNTDVFIKYKSISRTIKQKQQDIDLLENVKDNFMKIKILNHDLERYREKENYEYMIKYYKIISYVKKNKNVKEQKFMKTLIERAYNSNKKYYNKKHITYYLDQASKLEDIVDKIGNIKLTIEKISKIGRKYLTRPYNKLDLIDELYILVNNNLTEDELLGIICSFNIKEKENLINKIYKFSKLLQRDNKLDLIIKDLFEGKYNFDDELKFIKDRIIENDKIIHNNSNDLILLYFINSNKEYSKLLELIDANNKTLKNEASLTDKIYTIYGFELKKEVDSINNKLQQLKDFISNVEIIIQYFKFNNRAYYSTDNIDLVVELFENKISKATINYILNLDEFKPVDFVKFFMIIQNYFIFDLNEIDINKAYDTHDEPPFSLQYQSKINKDIIWKKLSEYNLITNYNLKILEKNNGYFSFINNKVFFQHHMYFYYKEPTTIKTEGKIKNTNLCCWKQGKKMNHDEWINRMRSEINNLKNNDDYYKNIITKLKDEKQVLFKQLEISIKQIEDISDENFKYEIEKIRKRINKNNKRKKFLFW